MKYGLSFFYRSAAIVMIASAVNFVPVPSYAILGLTSADVPLIVAGASTLGLGTFTVAAEALDRRSDDGGLAYLYGGFLVLAGIILLPDHGQVSPQFVALDSNSAKALGINEGEMKAYNSELDQINGIYQTITAETLKANQPDTSPAALKKFADNRWDVYSQESLTPDAQAVLGKVRANLASRTK